MSAADGQNACHGRDAEGGTQPEGSPAAAALERSYRRLLGMYPARHRRVHGEEMLGVLLAAAADGQRRPRFGEALDLAWAALRIRLRGRPADSDGQAAGGWRDALAAFSVAGPVALALLCVAGWLTGIVLYPRGLAPGGGLAGVALGVAVLGGLALPFVLLCLRRVAAVVCLAAAAVLAIIGISTLAGGMSGGMIGPVTVAVPFLAYATEATALLASPGPRRGLRIMTWRSWTLIAVGAAAAGSLITAISMAGSYAQSTARAAEAPLHLAGHPAAAPVTVAVVAAIAIAVAIGSAARSGLGRRVLLLFALPLYPMVAVLAWSGTPGPAYDMLAYLPPLAIAGVAVYAARRGRRAGTGGGQSASA
jgi:hypothetical protein